MLTKRNPIPVSKAIDLISAHYQTGETELVELTASYNRVLAEDLRADYDVPGFDRSPYDGYALRSQDTSDQTPVFFEVVGHIGAGSVYESYLEAKQAVRIMTGAAIPRGADAVIMLEDVTSFAEHEKTFVSINKKLYHHQNISFQGEDVKKGNVLVEKGTVINPGIIALLATFGYAKVPVKKKPVIGVIATGSELLEVDQHWNQGRFEIVMPI